MGTFSKLGSKSPYRIGADSLFWANLTMSVSIFVTLQEKPSILLYEILVKICIQIRGTPSVYNNTKIITYHFLKSEYNSSKSEPLN
jgi:hypothetical protein